VVDLFSILASGILVGTVYAYMAYGLGLIYGVLRVVNLAHGAFLTLGVYVTWWLNTTFGIDPLVSILITVPLGFVLGATVERTLVFRLRDSPPVTTLLLLFGVWLIVRNLLYLIFGGADRALLTSYSLESVAVGPLTISISRLIVSGFSLLGFVVLALLLKRTWAGLALRAVAQDREAAALSGVPVNRVWAIAFGIGSALAMSAGSLMSLFYSVTPEFGARFLLKSFCVVVLGGLTNIGGILIAGIGLGIAEDLTAFYVHTGYRDVVSFLVLTAALVARRADADN
jgi:branched-chain amino acid transport system permease protein